MKISVTETLTLIAPPAPLARKIAEMFTIENPVWIENQKMGRWNGGTQRFLPYFEARPEGLSVPRGALGQVFSLCKEQGITVEIIDQTRTLPEVAFAFSGQLRGYQRKAVDACLSRRSGIIEAPTGSGKTTMALAVICERKQPTLIVVHTKELLNQWRDRIEQFLGIPADQVGIIGGGKFQIGEKITVGIVNSVYGVAVDIRHHFGHIIVDECHKTPSRTFSAAVSAFDARYLLGLSATPFRRDGLTRLIGWYIGGTVKVDAAELTGRDIIQAVQVVPRLTSFRTCLDATQQYSRVLSELAENRERNVQIAVDIVKETRANGDGTCLILSDRKDHVALLRKILCDCGVNAVGLTGDTPAKERVEIVGRVNSGSVRVLVATGQLIGEGFDCRALSRLFLTMPVKFSGRLIQYLGRILRPAPGKTTARIFDYVDGMVPVLAASAKARRRVYQAKGWISA